MTDERPRELQIPLHRKFDSGHHNHEVGPRPRPLLKSLPVYYSLRGRMAHRVRYGALHLQQWELKWDAGEMRRVRVKIDGRVHLTLWCGQGGSLDKFGRLAAVPPVGWPLCGTCEGRAVGAGYPGVAILTTRYELLYSPRDGRAPTLDTSEREQVS